MGEGYRCCDTLERQDDIFVWELNPLPSYTHRHFVAYGIRPQNILSENYFPTKYFVCEKSKTPPQHQNHIHDKHAKAVLGGKKIGGGGGFFVRLYSLLAWVSNEGRSKAVLYTFKEVPRMVWWAYITLRNATSSIA